MFNFAHHLHIYREPINILFQGSLQLHTPLLRKEKIQSITLPQAIPTYIRTINTQWKSIKKLDFVPNSTSRLYPDWTGILFCASTWKLRTKLALRNISASRYINQFRRSYATMFDCNRVRQQRVTRSNTSSTTSSTTSDVPEEN